MQYIMGMDGNTYVMGDDDELIEGDDDEEAIMGAVRAPIRKVAKLPQRRPFVAKRPPLVLPSGAGIKSEIRTPLGVGQAVWGAAVTTDFPLVVEPQAQYRPERMIVDVREAGGVSAGLVVVRRIDVGVDPQTPSTEFGMPVSLFRPDATASAIDFTVIPPGIKFTVVLGITAAPGAGVTVTAVVGLYGRWIRN